MFRQQAITDPERAMRRPYVDRVLLVATALYALLPFGRLVLTGEGNQVDMGVATILLLLVLASLIDKRQGRAAPDAQLRKEEP